MDHKKHTFECLTRQTFAPSPRWSNCQIQQLCFHRLKTSIHPAVFWAVYYLMLAFEALGWQDLMNEFQLSIGSDRGWAAAFCRCFSLLQWYRLIFGSFGTIASISWHQFFICLKLQVLVIVSPGAERSLTHVGHKKWRSNDVFFFFFSRPYHVRPSAVLGDPSKWLDCATSTAQCCPDRMT